jgi:hypothetical protein
MKLMGVYWGWYEFDLENYSYIDNITYISN